MTNLPAMFQLINFISKSTKIILQKMTSVLPVRLVLFRVFLRKSDKLRLERQKPYSFSRNKALKCRGREIRTPDLLLPKQAPYRWATPRLQMQSYHAWSR